MQEPVINLAVMVEVDWDDEAGVWVASSDDVPGLSAEHSDFRALQAMVLELVPILLIENNILPTPHAAQEVSVHIAARATTRGRALIAA